MKTLLFLAMTSFLLTSCAHDAEIRKSQLESNLIEIDPSKVDKKVEEEDVLDSKALGETLAFVEAPLKRCQKSWSPQAKKVWFEARKWSLRYISQRGRWEMDREGTSADKIIVATQRKMYRQFINTVQGLCAGKVPPRSMKQLIVAELEMNRLYNEKVHKENLIEGEAPNATIEGIKKVQLYWYSYREQMVQLRKEINSSVSETTMKWMMTKDRVYWLERIYDPFRSVIDAS